MVHGRRMLRSVIRHETNSMRPNVLLDDVAEPEEPGKSELELLSLAESQVRGGGSGSGVSNVGGLRRVHCAAAGKRFAAAQGFRASSFKLQVSTVKLLGHWSSSGRGGRVPPSTQTPRKCLDHPPVRPPGVLCACGVVSGSPVQPYVPAMPQLHLIRSRSGHALSWTRDTLSRVDRDRHRWGRTYMALTTLYIPSTDVPPLLELHRRACGQSGTLSSFHATARGLGDTAGPRNWGLETVYRVSIALGYL
ncbi:hypothetical protein OH76DRAFT_1393 [Lentinus brumalis]|uniref:Uncharacterized protein n=1 Tax=Lentinus brumalis TaxID=2498619 RepID=A0A371DWK6_9APHY|nr:hypothetical protein OH76DRAFT_1393 [Polyporus brumalis]